MRLIRTTAPILLLLLLLAGCVGGYQTHTEYDPVRREMTTRVAKNVIGGFHLFGGNVVVNPARVLADDGTTRYYLSVQWSGREWLFIDRRAPLEIRTDAATLDLPGVVLTQDVGGCWSSGCIVNEFAHYHITPAQLRQIAGAHYVAVRLNGRSEYVERVFTPENRGNFARFVAQFAPDTATTTTR